MSPASSAAICPSANDGLGQSATLCVNNVTPAPFPGYVGETVTASGSIKVCTSNTACTTFPITLYKTGAGVNSADAVPTITYLGSTAVPLTSVCVGTTCTPGSANVPRYRVTLFPSSSDLAAVCVNGLCASTPLAPIPVTNAAGEPIAEVSA